MLGVKGIDANIGTMTFKYLYGAQGLLVFHQNITNQNYFRDADEAVNCSAPGKYSILAYINDTMKYNEKFEFLLKYDINENKYNRWRQSNNPILEKEQENIDEVEGFDYVHLDYNNTKFGGLAVKVFETQYNCINCLLAGCLGYSDWYYGIGQYDPCDPGWDNSIPGQVVDNNIKNVWLYIRVASTFLRIYASECLKKNNKFTVDLFVFITISALF